VAVVVGFVASILAAMPTGDWEAKLVYRHQPATFAAMEGHFHTEDHAAMVFIGQPNMETLQLDNPIKVPGLLSFLTHERWNAQVKGLEEFPQDEWPQFVPLVYYAYHIMAGLGTLFIALMAIALFFLWRQTLFTKRWLLWALMLAMPFPFIANTVGWVTAEAGRQPWIIWPAAHGKGHFAKRFLGQRGFHPAWVHGTLCSACLNLFRATPENSWPWAGTGAYRRERLVI